MQKASLDEAQAGIKIARRNIDNFRYADFCMDSNITADGDCSHEIKRCLLLEENLWQT